MKNDYVQQVKEDVAKKAGISLKKHRTIESVARQACAKLGLTKINREESESRISFAGRMVKHFGLGREHDAKVPDYLTRVRRSIAWNNYKNRRMGLR